MKRTHKKILGFFGLAVVAATTVFAAFLPAPETQATTQNTVVDSLTVRVIGTTPLLKIQGIEPGSTITSSSQHLTVPYENVNKFNLNVKYTGADNVARNFTLVEALVNYAPDQLTLDIDFLTGQYNYSYKYSDELGNLNDVTGAGVMPYYGYGDYIFEAIGEGFDEEPAYSSLSFAYDPVDANISYDENSGNIVIDLDYDTTSGSGQVGWVEVYIHQGDKNGKLVNPIPIIIRSPIKSYEFNPVDYGMEPGEYTFEVIAYSNDGKMLYKPMFWTLNYQVEDVDIPDTGGLFGNVNISKTDYLITGLTIFFLVGISSAIFIARRNNKNTRRKK